MKKCIDSSPLVIVRHYTSNNGKDVKDGKDKNDDLSCEENSRGDYVQESGDAEVQGPDSVVYIGSHGGDFSAVCAETGKVHWTLDLESRFYTTSKCPSMLESDPGSIKSVRSRVQEKEKEKESPSQQTNAHDTHDSDEQTSNIKGKGRDRAPQGVGGKRTGRVHVEGSASCNVTGTVLYVGCFRGEDVDGPVRPSERESGECIRLHGKQF